VKRLITGLSLALAVALGPTVAHARNVNGTVRGTLVAEYPGTCNFDYSRYCASGICECETFEGSINGKPIGHGDGWLALTIDLGASLDPDGPSCTPLYGTLILTTNRDTEELNATGTSCNGGPGSLLRHGGAILSLSNPPRRPRRDYEALRPFQIFVNVSPTPGRLIQSTPSGRYFAASPVYLQNSRSHRNLMGTCRLSGPRQFRRQV
jgi:hypothetical protein